KKEDIELEVIETKEFQDPNYLANPANRCYFCKSHLYEHLLEVRKKYPESVLINGANADDTGDYRPGQQAADELDIKSPLVDCGIDKASVRELARYFNLPNWNKPASPCLSSRVPYGLEITPVKLKQIESAEAILTGYGFSDVRVRHFDGEASIEVPSKEILLLEGKLNDIVPAIKALGFTKVCIDREGLVSGKLNRALKV
ncbi:MAG: ATP-dependent sacrificial sulfur transferase LarE, partial [Cyclobacteriaceae bacterium]|nr:ATP-dependent sacrificial sulfur transferase LarE [Cyclobacteriaceae bacterium]